jgi:hypothetical protein
MDVVSPLGVLIWLQQADGDGVVKVLQEEDGSMLSIYK